MEEDGGALGLKPEFIKTDWRIGADPKAIEDQLRKDKKKEIKAVCVLHNETSTGCLSPIADIRKAIDAAGHPALFLVDTISSLASADYRHDEWGVDVTVGGAQKGLMMPPGMSFNAISDKALKASQTSAMPKSFFAWDDMLNMNKIGFFPYTPATQMLHGLVTGIEMLHEEGLDNVFARHERLAEATRRAVKAWGLENLNKNAEQVSPTITAILLPEGHDADKFRALALDTFNISYGASFGPYAGKYFRIGHLGDVNDGTLIGALGITEMALALAGIPHKKGGVQAAIDYIVSAHAGAEARRCGVSETIRHCCAATAGLVPAVCVCFVNPASPAIDRAQRGSRSCADEAAVLGVLLGLVALGLAATPSARVIRREQFASWCRSRRAAASTRWRGFSGNKLSEQIKQPVLIEHRPAPAEISAPTRSPRPRRTATPCC